MSTLTPTPSGVSTPHRVQNVPGYTTPTFAGKKAQQEKVEDCVTSKGFVPRELVKNEVVWFYENLGIDDTYFAGESVEAVSDHVIALYGAKVSCELDLIERHS